MIFDIWITGVVLTFGWLSFDEGFKDSGSFVIVISALWPITVSFLFIAWMVDKIDNRGRSRD